MTDAAFQAHRTVRIEKSLCQVCYSHCRSYIHKQGLDIFGNSPLDAPVEKFDCPQCLNQFPASRYAPHLEKCLGMGRVSSRAANRKINSAVDIGSSPNPSESDMDVYVLEKKKKRKLSTSQSKKSKDSKKNKHKSGLLDDFIVEDISSDAS